MSCDNHILEPKGSRSSGHVAEASEKCENADSVGLPNKYANFDELAAPFPLHMSDKEEESSLAASEDAQCTTNGGHRPDQDEHDSIAQDHQVSGEEYGNLNELAAPSPVENPHKRRLYRRSDDLEEVRSEAHRSNQSHQQTGDTTIQPGVTPRQRRIQYWTHIVITSYLIMFAILGTLARLGLQALTKYPGAPVIVSEVWANVGGCVIMGYLSEDRFIFRREWSNAQRKARETADAERRDLRSFDSGADDFVEAAKQYHAAAK